MICDGPRLDLAGRAGGSAQAHQTCSHVHNFRVAREIGIGGGGHPPTPATPPGGGVRTRRLQGSSSSQLEFWSTVL
jgi:hypothetical protein